MAQSAGNIVAMSTSKLDCDGGVGRHAVVASRQVGRQDDRVARVQLVGQHAVRHRHDPDDGHVLDADRLRHLVEQGCDAGTLGEIRHGTPEGERLDITDCEVERLGHLDADRRLAGPGGQATRLDGGTVHVGVPPVGGPADHHLRPSLPELRTPRWCPVVPSEEELVSAACPTPASVRIACSISRVLVEGLITTSPTFARSR